MTTTVMVSLDGTDKDARALPVAAGIADLAGADIRLVHVIDAPTRHLAAEVGFLGLQEDAVTGRRGAEAHVTEVAARVAADYHHQVTWDVLESDRVAETLMWRATEERALVVVMATRAASPAGRALLGSVADRMVRECPTPVVLVPPGADYMRGRHVRFTRLLVPLDGSALAARALDFLLALPNASSLEYVLLEVVPSADRAAAEARLDEAADRVRARGAATVETAAIEASDPTPVIISALREALIDGIAMSTRGRGGLRRLMLGSVAEGVVRASEVPVLLLTPASLGGA